MCLYSLFLENAAKRRRKLKEVFSMWDGDRKFGEILIHIVSWNRKKVSCGTFALSSAPGHCPPLRRSSSIFQR
jgi:hypothetical protein